MPSMEHDRRKRPIALFITISPGLTNVYRSHGRYVARRPWIAIIACVLATALTAIGFVRLKVEDDAAKLYTRPDAPSFKDKEYVDALYSPGPYPVKVMALDKAGQGGNVLTKEHLLEHLRSIRQILDDSIVVHGRSYSYRNVCQQRQYAPDSMDCEIDSILSFWDYDEAILLNDPDILKTINDRAVPDSNGRLPSLSWLLGGLGTDPRTGSKQAEVLHTVYNLKDVMVDGSLAHDVTYEWEKRIKQIAQDDWRSKYTVQYIVSDGILRQESAKAIRRDVSLTAGSYVLLTLCTVVVLFRNSWAYQKAHLAFASLLATGMSISANFGMLSAFGVKFNLTCQVLAFMMLELGIMSTFIIVSNYFAQDPNLPLEQRVGEAIGLAGPSLTVSSVAICLAFAFGAASALPAIKNLSGYASLGSVLVCTYQVTIFLACLVLDARRELRARQDINFSYSGAIVPFDADPVESLGGGAGRTRDGNMVTHTSLSVNVPGPVTTPAILCFGKQTFHPHDDQLSTRLFVRTAPDFTLSGHGKLTVVFLELLLLGFAVYGCRKATTDFNFQDGNLPKANWLHGVYELQSRYFGGDKVPIAIYTRKTDDGRDYFYYQDQLSGLENVLRASVYITDVPPVTSWYSSFQHWINRPNSTYATRLADGMAPNEKSFRAWIQEWLNSDGMAFKPDIVFRPDTDIIIGSRITAYTQGVKGVRWAMRCVDATRQIARDAAPNLNAIAYGVTYTVWDGFRSITAATISHVYFAALTVTIVTVLLLGDILGGLMVGLMVVLCDACIFGLMHYAGLQNNSVTCILLVLAVVIAVDYSTHIVRAFLVSIGTRKERIQKALVSVGSAVWNSAASMFIMLLPIAGARHYMFLTIFSMFSILLLLALWHGVLLLPVLLSWVGPPSCRKQEGHPHQLSIEAGRAAPRQPNAPVLMLEYGKGNDSHKASTEAGRPGRRPPLLLEYERGPPKTRHNGQQQVKYEGDERNEPESYYPSQMGTLEIQASKRQLSTEAAGSAARKRRPEDSTHSQEYLRGPPGRWSNTQPKDDGRKGRTQTSRPGVRFSDSNSPMEDYQDGMEVRSYYPGSQKGKLENQASKRQSSTEAAGSAARQGRPEASTLMLEYRRGQPETGPKPQPTEDGRASSRRTETPRPAGSKHQESDSLLLDYRDGMEVRSYSPSRKGKMKSQASTEAAGSAAWQRPLEAPPLLLEYRTGMVKIKDKGQQTEDERAYAGRTGFKYKESDSLLLDYRDGMDVRCYSPSQKGKMKSQASKRRLSTEAAGSAAWQRWLLEAPPLLLEYLKEPVNTKDKSQQTEDVKGARNALTGPGLNYRDFMPPMVGSRDGMDVRSYSLSQMGKIEIHAYKRQSSTESAGRSAQRRHTERDIHSQEYGKRQPDTGPKPQPIAEDGRASSRRTEPPRPGPKHQESDSPKVEYQDRVGDRSSSPSEKEKMEIQASKRPLSIEAAGSSARPKQKEGAIHSQEYQQGPPRILPNSQPTEDGGTGRTTGSPPRPGGAMDISMLKHQLSTEAGSAARWRQTEATKTAETDSQEYPRGSPEKLPTIKPTDDGREGRPGSKHKESNSPTADRQDRMEVRPTSLKGKGKPEVTNYMNTRS